MNVAKLKRGIGFAALLTACMAGLVNQSFADTDLQFAKYLQFVKWSGDYRLRYDNQHFRSPSTTADRGRFRMRLRLATDFGLPGRLTLKTRLASGVGEQTSTNQTFGSLSDQKGIWIDRAYLEWKPKDFMTLSGGKMTYPLWSQYSTDAIWDADLNPEGAGEQFSFLLGGVNLFANALQMVADEKSNTLRDLYVFSEQFGVETHLPFESRLKLAWAYHDWKNAKGNSFTGVPAINNGTSAEKLQEGNRGTPTALANDFGVSEITSELSSWIGKIPLSLQATIVENMRAKKTSKYNQKMNKGYQVGTIVGKAGAAQSWEAGYFYKYLEADATVADAADSDFGDGGTNRRGHIMWLAYSPLDFLTLQAKYFQTKNIEKTLTVANGGQVAPKGTMDRIQVDVSVKF